MDYRTNFNISAHKKEYGTNDLEVIIAPNGEIAYAIPSHQEYMLARAQEVMHLSRKGVENACPNEYYGIYLYWLYMVNSGFLPVWTKFVLNVEVTPAQYAALRTLKLNGLYKGKLPKIRPLHVCPVCGAKAKLSVSRLTEAKETSYKYDCPKDVSHISDACTFSTKLKAQQDWERRCMEYCERSSSFTRG